MTSRALVLGVLVVSAVTMCLAQQSTPETAAREHWLTERMNNAYAIKPGMTAAALAERFQYASAFAHPNGTYVYLLRECPLIRLDVTFAEVTDENWTNIVK